MQNYPDYRNHNSSVMTTRQITTAVTGEHFAGLSSLWGHCTQNKSESPCDISATSLLVAANCASLHPCTRAQCKYDSESLELVKHGTHHISCLGLEMPLIKSTMAIGTITTKSLRRKPIFQEGFRVDEITFLCRAQAIHRKFVMAIYADIRPQYKDYKARPKETKTVLTINRGKLQVHAHVGSLCVL